MLRKWLCQADITLALEPQDPILIKSGYATIDGPDMVPVSTFRDGKQLYFFPGSSLKGALRSHFERIARTLQAGSVCIPYLDPKKNDNSQIPVPSEAKNSGCGYNSSDDKNPAHAYSQSCAACRLFGSLRFCGRFSIGDAYPIKEPTLSTRNGVVINRFTGGAQSGLLFDLNVIEGGQFQAKIRIVNFEMWQLAALNFLLYDLEDELIFIGSGRSRGLGRIKGTIQDYTITYVRPQSRLVALYELASDEERTAYRFHSWSPQATFDLPTPVVHGLRQKYNLKERWKEIQQNINNSLDDFLKIPRLVNH